MVLTLKEQEASLMQGPVLSPGFCRTQVNLYQTRRGWQCLIQSAWPPAPPELPKPVGSPQREESGRSLKKKKKKAVPKRYAFRVSPLTSHPSQGFEIRDETGGGGGGEVEAGRER